MSVCGFAVEKHTSHKEETTQKCKIRKHDCLLSVLERGCHLYIGRMQSPLKKISHGCGFVKLGEQAWNDRWFVGTFDIQLEHLDAFLDEGLDRCLKDAALVDCDWASLRVGCELLPCQKLENLHRKTSFSTSPNELTLIPLK